MSSLFLRYLIIPNLIGLLAFPVHLCASASGSPSAKHVSAGQKVYFPFFSSKGKCFAVRIAEQLVVTPAHCLEDDDHFISIPSFKTVAVELRTRAIEGFDGPVVLKVTELPTWVRIAQVADHNPLLPSEKLNLADQTTCIAIPTEIFEKAFSISCQSHEGESGIPVFQNDKVVGVNLGETSRNEALIARLNREQVSADSYPLNFETHGLKIKIKTPKIIKDIAKAAEVAIKQVVGVVVDGATAVGGVVQQTAEAIEAGVKAAAKILVRAHDDLRREVSKIREDVAERTNNLGSDYILDKKGRIKSPKVLQVKGNISDIKWPKSGQLKIDKARFKIDQNFLDDATFVAVAASTVALAVVAPELLPVIALVGWLAGGAKGGPVKGDTTPSQVISGCNLPSSDDLKQLEKCKSILHLKLLSLRADYIGKFEGAMESKLNEEIKKIEEASK